METWIEHHLNLGIAASPEGQITEMRHAFLKNLAQEGGYDTYPFGKPEKRVHGLYIKHNGDTAADAFCPYHTRLHCPFRVKIRMTSQQLLIWTAYEHDHNPANDTSKHIKVATAKKVKQVIADAPIGDIIFLFIPFFCQKLTFSSVRNQSCSASPRTESRSSNCTLTHKAPATCASKHGSC